MTRRARGFTLVELLVVLGILALLAGLVFPTASFVVRAARIERSREEVAALAAAVLDYDRDVLRPPDPSWGDPLSALVVDPGVPGWRGPYVSRSGAGSGLDPWGRPYLYRLATGDAQALVLGTGPDGRLDSDLSLEAWTGVGWTVSGDDLAARASFRPIEIERADRVRAQLARLARLLVLEFERTGAYPSSLEALLAGGLAEGTALTDPWRNPLFYRAGGSLPPEVAAVWSAGPDGSPDTADDLVESAVVATTFAELRVANQTGAALAISASDGTTASVEPGAGATFAIRRGSTVVVRGGASDAFTILAPASRVYR